ncbi:chromate resistance protein ChrB domain-containing protein [Methylomicrobium sp. Wu6]|uniref:chromate resistance protein ChrB domain-containing protein n=1 Tax=Methylomicrobium sp. Wu6 TaxID=3107928 RepID=UPI002DD67048|nr:chromate resistance protein ChrB domain-containing protein [Methylomicrobium sp. Wu6]MEC4748345.1 chromate resistance protein [Methylomicrobium sp. Wu6]
MKWVTRERPKIDRIACPWLIARFIDPEPEFLYVPAGEVLRVAAETGATPYDIPDVELGHHGDHCSFDAVLAKYALHDPVLARLAVIVRAADCKQPELAQEAAGLVAISLGLSLNFTDDHAMLKQGMVVYDALYAWCRGAPLAEAARFPPSL